jgi:anti-anti-sigma regulatory factor
VTTRHTDDNFSLVLEGRVKGPWVAELQQAWQSALEVAAKRPITVDLSAVSFADERGRRLLRQMRVQGAKLVGSSNFLKSVLEGSAGSVSEGEI